MDNETLEAMMTVSFAVMMVSGAVCMVVVAFGAVWHVSRYVA